MTRGRKPLLVPSRSLHIHLDSKLMEAVDARLFSEAEQRVPKGAYQAFVTEAIVRMLRQQPLDLSPFAGCLPQEHVVYAFPGTKELLQKTLAQGSGASDKEKRDEAKSGDDRRGRPEADGRRG